MAISPILLDKFKKLFADISVLFGLVIDTLSDAQSSQTDWNNGTQMGTPGTDFPATTSSSILTIVGATLNVVSTAEFSIGDTNVAYLIITDGVDIEIMSYQTSNATQFLALTRGLYGTTIGSWANGSDVYQLVHTHGVTPSFDLGIQKKNYTQEAIVGSNPSSRAGAKMIYRPMDGNYYMFGGWTGAAYLNDLWKFDPSTNTWTQLTPAANPSIRAFHAMVYMEEADEIWVHGGTTSPTTNRLGDVWKYSFSAGNWITNGAWTATARHSHMAISWPGNEDIDPQMIISGGSVIPFDNVTKQTRWFDGTTWIIMANSPQEWARGDAAYLLDSDCMFVVGIGQGGSMRGASYDPNLNSWTQSAPSPAKRRYPTLVPDQDNAVALMFGGTLDQTNGTDTLYSYSKAADTWTQLANYAREVRFQHVAAWDSANNEMLIWGGRVAAPSTFPAFPDPIRFRYFWQEATFRTQTIDLGEVPALDGIWILEDLKDLFRELTSTEYSFEWSDDDIAWTPVAGVIIDGDAITDLHQYYRATVIMTNDGLSFGPTVQKIDANFDEIEWVSFANKPVGDFAPVIRNISALSTQVDPLKATSKIGTMTVELLNSSRWAQRLITDLFPKNKTVFIKVGVYQGGEFDAADFTDIFKGRLDDWDFGDGIVTFKVKDFLAEFKKQVPQEDNLGVITPLQYNAGGIAAHPVDILKDLILNQLNIPDRDVDLDSFETVRTDPSLDAWAFNRIITSPEDAYKMVQEICRHIGAVIILRETGTLALKILDPAEDPFDEWDEKTQMFKKPRFLARSVDTIRNYISTWWGWDGDGDEIGDFGGVEVETDADSVANWGVNVLRTKSKWLGGNANPYFGATRAQEISQRMLDIGKNGTPAITFETCIGAIAANAGDVVRVQSSVIKSLVEYIRWQAKYNPQRDLVFVDETGRFSLPYLAFGVSECIDMKFFVTKKQVNFAKGTIKWELHRAREVPLGKAFTSQSDFEQGSGDFIDLVTTPGSILVNLSTIFTLLDGCEVADWTQVAAALPEVLNPVDFIEDANSLDLGKNGTNIFAPYEKTLGVEHDGTDKSIFAYFDIVDKTELSITSGLSVQIGSASNAKYVLNYDRSELVNGWQRLGGALPGVFTVSGTPDITKLDYLRTFLQSPTASDTIASGNAKMDFWHLVNGDGTAVYELIIDMTQQPERDGEWSFTDTIPGGTSIVYEADASETGDFLGEHLPIGVVNDTDPITLKARYYRIRATMTPNIDFSVSPSIEEIAITFDDG